ncbi:hypothetical protein IW261DRAFT_1603301 [Armillaria novae-zelandiae]|uniref:Uncharacterized protein n=1 Tax=Armillaria novae-zelandiae TaxID=153914 RepID=A0AA39PNZ7_9AGAR|nr:hypothetical protein IW261DRAFT_1603301 [Armillaria novae-zelandiae]
MPVRNLIGVDIKVIVAKSYASLMGRGATLGALCVHTTDDLLHSSLQLDVTYRNLVRFGGWPEQTIFLYKAYVTPFSEAPWLMGMEVDFKEAQEIRSNGGTGSRALAFVCFQWEQDGRMIGILLRFDLTAQPTPGHQHISAWKPILYGVICEQISMGDLSRDMLQAGTTESSIDLNDMDFEDIVDDMETLSMVSIYTSSALHF